MRHALARSRSGTVLIVTMIVVFALAWMVLVLCRSMRVEAVAAANRASAVEASAILQGAEQYILALLKQDKQEILKLPEQNFEAVAVGGGYFWVLRNIAEDPTHPGYGVIDESSKLNVNRADFDTLMRIPSMSQEIAAAIVDWRDSDSEITPAGAESEYYLAQNPPSICKNAPLETLEELLLVKGIDAMWLYENSSDVSGLAEGVARQNSLTMADLLTVYGVESNVTAGGEPRININNIEQRPRLRELLNSKLGTGRGDQILGNISRNRQPFKDVFDFYFQTEMKIDELEQVIDSITTIASPLIVGRININTASATVLETLDNLDSADVQKILSSRQGQSSLAWVVEALDTKAVGLGEKITDRSYQYSADILAVSGNGRSFKRCRIVVDTSRSGERIIYRRDLTDRGWPLDPGIIEDLRRGVGIRSGLSQGVLR